MSDRLTTGCVIPEGTDIKVRHGENGDFLSFWTVTGGALCMVPEGRGDENRLVFVYDLLGVVFECDEKDVTWLPLGRDPKVVEPKFDMAALCPPNCIGHDYDGNHIFSKEI